MPTGARHSQQSFLPLVFLVFLELALPVLKAALGPLAHRGWRGFPQGHQTAFFLAEVWRCTSKKLHKLQPVAGPENVWTSTPPPSPNSQSLCSRIQLSCQPRGGAPPPKESRSQRTGGRRQGDWLAVAPMDRTLGFVWVFLKDLFI